MHIANYNNLSFIILYLEYDDLDLKSKQILNYLK